MIGNKHKEVEIFFGEVCRDNEEEREWGIPFQIGGQEFQSNLLGKEWQRDRIY